MPSPWIARAASSSGTFCTVPAASDPPTNIRIAICTSSFLLNRSENLLQIGLLTVIASREAVTTQVYWVWVPSRSAMIVGSAVETIVVLTIATKSADISPMRTSTISLWVISVSRDVVARVTVLCQAWASLAFGAGWWSRSQVLDHAWRGDLLEGPVAEPLGQRHAHRVACLDESLAALRRDRDQLGPPVVGVGAPGDQAQPVEPASWRLTTEGSTSRAAAICRAGAPPRASSTPSVTMSARVRSCTLWPQSAPRAFSDRLNRTRPVEQVLDGLRPLRLERGGGMPQC